MVKIVNKITDEDLQDVIDADNMTIVISPVMLKLQGEGVVLNFSRFIQVHQEKFAFWPEMCIYFVEEWFTNRGFKVAIIPEPGLNFIMRWYAKALIYSRRKAYSYVGIELFEE